MTKKNRDKLRLQQFEFIIKTDDYKAELSDLSNEISNASKKAENEASIVTIFELELFSFIKDVLGLKYYPEKEKSINTERHISKGRIDSKIGALVIEFKHTSKLKLIKDKEKASNQLKDYLLGLSTKHSNDYWGFITDGTQCKFVNIESGHFIESAYENINGQHLDKIIKSIVLLEKTALTPENLIKDFCDDKDSLSKRLVLCLYSTLKNKPTGRSLMLFNEWKELFRLAHNDKSKQVAIEERRDSLAKVVSARLENNEEEYLALYALQTSYAIIVKIIAYKVISKIRFNKSLIDFNELSSANFDVLRLQMNSLEDGAIFRGLGIGNLLEGDFFAWYSTNEQWNNELGKLIQEIFIILTNYEDKALFENGENVSDLFKDLFMKIIPDKVRHSLGEFYTPPWLADNLIIEAIKKLDTTKDWTAIDPCAGSGTFLTVLIKKVLEESSELSKKEKLYAVLNRVKGIDLNPLAVLTARINYFINISPLIDDTDNFEIPVYLGDSSYVPANTLIESIECVSYKIQTIKGYIEIDLPISAVSDSIAFSQTMTSIENDIHNLDVESITNKILALVSDKEKTATIISKINYLAEQFVELEKNDWNGIWARIVTNFLTTANLGKFDLIVGNPPWIDWRSLPEGYRERIKTICVERHLFSGDGMTGGINLNVCALISNVAAKNWLKNNGILAFLMPQSLIFQQTYEGFRDFYLDDNTRMYFQEFFDWTMSGHPFKPVQHKFLTYFLSQKPTNYSSGIPLKYYIKKSNENLDSYSNINDFEKVKNAFTIKNIIAGQPNPKHTIFSYAQDLFELEKFSAISGMSSYTGRQGIEFYPQELYLLKVDTDMPTFTDKVFVKNSQIKKSKYKIPRETFILEKKYLHPLIKGVDIERFHLKESKLIVPFPYEPSNTRSPIPIKELSKKSKLLAEYFNKFKQVILQQTNYNDKIIGEKNNNEFYALARTGDYTFAENYVAFRDNTKWQAVVISSIKTPWNEIKTPKFQKHAVSISQDEKGNFITLDEAHFICAILNAPISKKFILNSSDSRSFKIRPQLFIPKYDKLNKTHLELSNLSKEAHEVYKDKIRMKEIDLKLDSLIVKIKPNS
ncbi:Eco57I restriction-modification methylase domain-containing protein [Flavobacterium piscis]|uniref:site-specific DNA-methyltransferase (adenine-specific) n=1 Tax=Flavobacterium piscis TaxID=1114874 RepID=A0ABU1Y2G9_9FLAO|nr:N-6 DNA methylase [Flavobacterium piscis]MDR7208412.1 methylase of polypeptide subunit release factors [Flavobacterium piscis]